jgi:hypothetical protein
MTFVTSSVVAYTGDRHFYSLAWTDGAVGSLAVNVLNRNIRVAPPRSAPRLFQRSLIRAMIEPVDRPIARGL